MTLTKQEILHRIWHFKSNALVMHDANDNAGVLKWLFMIEFYKDFLEQV